MARRLRASLPSERAQAVLALLDGRRAAAAKFDDAGDLFLDRAAAEQASPAEVARYTAGRLARATASQAPIADLGCGAGADSLALAEFARVVAVDRAEARLAMLAANAAMRGVTSRVQLVCADFASWAAPLEVGACWLDPSRRDERGRLLDPSTWAPPFERALEVARRYPAAGIKLAPGIDAALLPEEGEIEFISLRGRLVEAVLWLGAAATPGLARATVLPEGASLARDRAAPDSVADVRPPGALLYDPDPAIGRAGVVRTLATALAGWQLNEQVAYLSSNEVRATPFARRFRVLEARPFSERAAREALAAAGTGRLEVMRRGAPVDTNALERRLNARLPGGKPVHTLALTRVDGRITLLLCEREREVAGA